MGGACSDVLYSSDVVRCKGDGVLICDVGQLSIEVVVHNIKALLSWPLSDDVLQSIREHTARASVFKNCSCHMEVLWVVKHSVSVEEEMPRFI